MVGRPLRAAMIDELQRLAVAHYEDDLHTHLEFACQYIGSGRTIQDLARELSPVMVNGVRKDVSRIYLSRYLHEEFGEAGSQAIDAARLQSADALAEEALSIVDDASTQSREHLQHAKMRAEQRTWLAGKFNRPRYGEDKATINVGVSVGSMALESFRRREVVPVAVWGQPASLPAPEVVEP